MLSCISETVRTATRVCSTHLFAFTVLAVGPVTSPGLLRKDSESTFSLSYQVGMESAHDTKDIETVRVFQKDGTVQDFPNKLITELGMDWNDVWALLIDSHRLVAIWPDGHTEDI